MNVREIADWVLFAYLFVISMVFSFIAWTFWIWRDGILTPEETTAAIIGPLLALGPLAVMLDAIIGVLLIRFLRRRSEGHSSSSATE